MKRDWELIKILLLEIEKLPPEGKISPGEIKGFPVEVVNAHLELLKEAGFIKAKCDYWCIARGLTWKGYELLDTLRERPLWNEIQKIAKEKGLTLSFEVIQTLSKVALERLIGG